MTVSGANGHWWFNKGDASFHPGPLLLSYHWLPFLRRAPKVTVTRSGEKEGVVAPKHLLPGSVVFL
jgi:hypothetical protein